MVASFMFLNSNPGDAWESGTELPAASSSSAYHLGHIESVHIYI